MTDAKKKQVPVSTVHEGVLMRIASKVSPAKLFSSKDKEKNVLSSDKQQRPKKLSVEFLIPSDEDNNENDNHKNTSHDINSSHNINSQHSTFQNSLRARSKSTSCLTGPRLEYNPYGIYNHQNIQRLGSAFGNGNSGKNESDTILPSPTSTPNDHLPEFYHEEIQNFEEKYKLSDNDIGFGGSATIKKVFIKNDNNKNHQYFALKKFSIYTSESLDKYYNRVATEYTITRGLIHLHTISCYELLQLPLTLQRAWGMVLPYYNYDLYKLIKNPEWKKVSFSEKMCVFKQVCFGLKFIHEQDFAHLDIKADNVMVARNGIMKITDFGCSEIGHTEYGNFQSKVALKSIRLGTPPYQPPEVAKYSIIDNRDSRQPYCPFKFDYWSLGILLYVIAFGKIPFNSTKDSDTGFQLFKVEYTYYLETNPLFSKDLSTKIPKNGSFSDPHGYDPNLIYIFWRLCDPNTKTRMTLPKLFHNKFFQGLEMCVNERLYECNFCKHEKSKQMKFDIPLGDTTEVSMQNEIKHSLWDDIPTICSTDQEQNNINNADNTAFKNNKETFDNGRYINSDINDNSLPVVDECEGEYECENSIENELKRCNLDKNYITSHARTSESASSSIKRRNSLGFLNSQSFKAMTPTYPSVCRQTSHNPFSFAYPEKASNSYFSDDDYQDAEKYMIVNFDDICDACNYKVVPHSHNMLYNYKEK